MEKESIKKYFEGKTIFVTGATGFVGKVLLEQLLRTCPDVEKIYILVRPKKGKSPQERVEHITSFCLFDLLKQKYPKNIGKIIPVSGDTTQIGLGLSDKDRQMLIDEVHIFYHAAASVRFDDCLKDAILTNIRSAREAAFLVLDMKKIELFMHVSTAYCNVNNRKVVQPILYPPQGNWKDMITIAEECDTYILDAMSQKIIEGFPNTYTYSKQLAEHCINDMLGGKIPMVIIRPSIVIFSIADPFQGWIDNYNGPSGLMLAGASGFMRVLYADTEIFPDYVAVDNLVKFMVVIAWHKVNFGKKNEIEIYNGSGYDHLPFSNDLQSQLGSKIYWEEPLSRKIWFPRIYTTACWYNYFLNVIIFHMIPAFLIDTLLLAAGHQPMLFTLQRKIYIANLAISYFVLNEWYFVNTTTMAILDFIPKNEREDFAFDIKPSSKKQVYEYLKSAKRCARILLLKEDKEITERTRTVTRWMYYLDRACYWIFYGLMFWLIFFKINILTVIWHALCNYWDSL